jgi:transcriptional regulator with XRE-family HTH domain
VNKHKKEGEMPRSPSRIFARLLREARRHAGLSQRDLAAEAEIDGTYTSLLERGLRTPTIDVFVRLCRALKIEPHELMRKITAALD